MTEKEDDISKKRFVQLMRYSTPVTVGILLYVAFFPLAGNAVVQGVVGLLIALEVLTGLKAEAIYEFITPNKDEESGEDDGEEN